MSDDTVDFKVTADNSAALTALEQMAAAMTKMGEKGKESGEKSKQGADWAGQGFEEMEGKLIRSISAAEIASKVYEALAASLERVRDRAKEAADAQKEIGGVQQSWAEQLRTGTDPKAFNKAIEQIAKDTGNVPSQVGEAAAIALNSRTTQTDDDVLVALREGARQSHAPGGMGRVAANVLQFRKIFPEASPEGAEAVIAAHGSSPDFMGRELPGLAMMRSAGGGKDSFEFLETMMAGMGPRAQPISIKALLNAAHRLGGMPGSIERGTMQEQWEWLKSAGGKNTARAIFGGLLENPAALEGPGGESLANDVAGKIGLGRADPGVVRNMAEMLGGKGEAAARMRRPVVNFNDPAAIVALRGQQSATADLPAQQLAASDRGVLSALEDFDLSNPEGVIARSQATEEAMSNRLGWGFLGLARFGQGALHTSQRAFGTSAEDVIASTRRNLKGTLADETSAGGSPEVLNFLKQLIESNEKLVKALQDMHREPRTLKITHDGESADQNATTTAHAAGH